MSIRAEIASGPKANRHLNEDLRKYGKNIYFKLFGVLSI
jgi:hypothetical protein